MTEHAMSPLFNPSVGAQVSSDSKTRIDALLIRAGELSGAGGRPSLGVRSHPARDDVQEAAERYRVICEVKAGWSVVPCSGPEARPEQ